MSGPEFEDTFDGDELDPGRWLPWYLPHWSSRERAAARYEVGGGRLRLRIDRDQEPWCPEWDGDVRTSSLQTGAFCGPIGSDVGQLRFKPGLVVREEQEDVRLYTPRYGRFEVRMRALDDPAAMVAFWMIGYEDQPDRSGEICIAEIFGRDVHDDHAAVGMGIHPFHDPRLREEWAQERVEIDARELHVYAAEWTPGGVAWFVDGDEIKRTTQSPDYPMQLMIDVYEFRDGGPPRGDYPKVFEVDRVRGYSVTDT